MLRGVVDPLTARAAAMLGKPIEELKELYNTRDIEK